MRPRELQLRKTANKGHRRSKRAGELQGQCSQPSEAGRGLCLSMSEITPETLLTAGGLVLMTIFVWWGGKAAKGWFWAFYAVLMVLALAYALWRWLV